MLHKETPFFTSPLQLSFAFIEICSTTEKKLLELSGKKLDSLIALLNKGNIRKEIAFVPPPKPLTKTEFWGGLVIYDTLTMAKYENIRHIIATSTIEFIDSHTDLLQEKSGVILIDLATGLGNAKRHRCPQHFTTSLSHSRCCYIK